MSMSEFDEQLNNLGKNSSSFFPAGHILPADFSEEEMVFAEELDTLFPVKEEQLPPYFVQTLLDAEEPRFQPVEHGFEHKTRARVFRRLKLRRRLFYAERPSLHALMRKVPLRGSLAIFAACMVFMLLSVIFTGPSFAAGMQILLRGAPSGVIEVPNYPTGLSLVPPPSSNDEAQQRIGLLQAQLQLHSWNMYWPQAIPDKYSLNGITLYQDIYQSWSDGPFMELDYSYFKGTSQGSGQIAIREFKLAKGASVFQVVKDGASQGIKIDSSGRAQAIYVDGQWSLRNKIYPRWTYGSRSELIYQRDGIVFWIVGDQRDGMNKAALLNVANSLRPFDMNTAMLIGLKRNTHPVSLLTSDTDSLFTGDLLAVYPYDGTVETPYLSVLGSDQPAPGKFLSKGLRDH